MRSPPEPDPAPASGDLWRLRSATVGNGYRFDGWRLIGPRLLTDDAGGLLWLMQPPARRDWPTIGRVWFDAVGWTLRDDGGGAILTAAAPDAAFDVMEMRGAPASAFLEDRSESLTVFGTFAPLSGPDDLTRYLMAGEFIVTDGRREGLRVEQPALSLYRIARRRGGAFWVEVAAHIAELVAARVEQAPNGVLVHDDWYAGETHVRHLVDALMLLVAEAERTGQERFDAAARRAGDALEEFGVPFAGGTWYLHDSLERDSGRNDLVLNTHIYALIGLLALGRDISAGMRAVEAALAMSGAPVRALAYAALLAIDDLRRALRPYAGRERTARLRVRETGSRLRAPRLRLVSGWIARDVRPLDAFPVISAVAPAHYFTVNLADLASLAPNRASWPVTNAFRQGLRYARATGSFRAQRKVRHPMSVIVPVLLRMAGERRWSAREAKELRAAGFAPAVGWPGYEDALWSRLVPGTP